MRRNFTAWVLHCTHHEAPSETFPAGGEFLFEIDAEPLEECVTART